MAEIEQWEEVSEQLLSDERCTKEQAALLAHAVEQIHALRARLAMEAQQRAKLRDQIEQVILRVSDENQRLLLSLRYIDGLTWEQVAEEMYYSVRNAVRLHLSALDQILCEKISKKSDEF